MFVRTAAISGGLVGVLVAGATGRTAHLGTTATAHGCGLHGASRCLDNALLQTVMPFARDGLLGVLVGAGVAALLLVTLGRLARTAALEPHLVRDRIGPRVRSEVWTRDEGSCVDCGSAERLGYEHVVPVRLGGSRAAANVELRCQPCSARRLGQG